MKLKLLFLLVFIVIGQVAAQTDSITVAPDSAAVRYKPRKIYVIDSVAMAKAKHLRDSLTWTFVKPDPLRPNQFVEQMLEKYVVKDITLLSTQSAVAKKKSDYGLGKPVQRLPAWVLLVMLVLVVAFGIVRIVFRKQMDIIFQAFYDNRVLSQINKEDNIFSSWYFLFSYVLFSFLIGLFLYILFQKLGLTFTVSGFTLFLTISLCFAVFLGLKILILRFMAYMFELYRVISDYINVIYLSFFNLSLFFIPLTLSLILTVFQENNWILLTGLLITTIVFVMQFLRILIQILSNYRLSKFYLILYLCALEICPIIVIIKALNI